MSFNTSWDIDQYKTEYESEEHWELRRNFMLKHKDSYPEERLVCLAQVFTNVEFLGCRYPQETMELVAQLSEGVAEDYREKQKSKLQRTFVKASDAAEAKFKGLKRPTAVGEHGPSKIAKYSNGPSFVPAESKINSTLHSEDYSLENGDIKKDNMIKQFTNNLSPKLKSDSVNELSKDLGTCASTTSSCKIESASDTLIVPKIEDKEVERSLTIEDVTNEKFGLLLILEAENDHPFSTLLRSTRACRIKFEEKYVESSDKVYYCKIFVNHHLLTTKSALTKGIAQDMAIVDAYEKLKQICYTLKIKKSSIGKLCDEKEDTCTVHRAQSTEHNANTLDTPLEENIGSKLMRSMGWTGGGLGKNKQGIEEPVGLSKQIRRTGLGHASQKGENGSLSHTFCRNAKNLLQNYMDKHSLHDLVFSTDYTKEERAFLHRLAAKYKLQSKSYGNKICRKLVISRRGINILKIVENLLKTKTYSNEEFELIKPSITLPVESESNSQENKCLSLEVTPVSTTEKLPNNQGSSERAPAVEWATISENMKDDDITNSCSLAEKYSVNHRYFLRPRKTKHTLDAGQFGRFILIENGFNVRPAQVIERSANSCHVHFGYEYKNDRGEITCKLLINNALVSSCPGTSKKAAREKTLMRSIAKLREMCYTLRIEEKQEDTTIKIIKTLIFPTTGACENESKAETQIACESKQVTKATVGIRGDEMLFVFKNKVRNVLGEYISHLSPYDLVISSDFSSPEQLCIQQLASSVALKSTLRGEPSKQVLVVSKKLTPLDTAEALLHLYSNASNCVPK